MFLFLVKYPFISEMNANIQNPLKSPFEVVNYYVGLNSKPRVQKPIILPSSFTSSKYLLKLFGELVLCSLYTKQFNFEGIQFTSVKVMREKT